MNVCGAHPTAWWRTSPGPPPPCTLKTGMIELTHAMEKFDRKNIQIFINGGTHPTAWWRPSPGPPAWRPRACGAPAPARAWCRQAPAGRCACGRVGGGGGGGQQGEWVELGGLRGPRGWEGGAGRGKGSSGTGGGGVGVGALGETARGRQLGGLQVQGRASWGTDGPAEGLLAMAVPLGRTPALRQAARGRMLPPPPAAQPTNAPLGEGPAQLNQHITK